MVDLPSWLTCYLMFCMHTILRCAEAGWFSLEEAFDRLAWSFNFLNLGIHPTVNWKLEPIYSEKAHRLIIPSICLIVSYREGGGEGG